MLAVASLLVWPVALRVAPKSAFSAWLVQSPEWNTLPFPRNDPWNQRLRQEEKLPPHSNLDPLGFPFLFSVGPNGHWEEGGGDDLGAPLFELGDSATDIVLGSARHVFVLIGALMVTLGVIRRYRDTCTLVLGWVSISAVSAWFGSSLPGLLAYQAPVLLVGSRVVVGVFTGVLGVAVISVFWLRQARSIDASPVCPSAKEDPA